MKEVIYKSLAFMGYSKYEVGDDGTVWSIQRSKRKMLSLNSKVRGYHVVCLIGDGPPPHYIKPIHRLVLLAFVGPCPKGMECCHEDGNRSNNTLTNLSWGTKKKNQGDRVRHGTSNRGELNYSAKLTEAKVRKIRKMFSTGKWTFHSLAEKVGMSKASVWRVVTRTNWKHIE